MFKKKALPYDPNHKHIISKEPIMCGGYKVYVYLVEGCHAARFESTPNSVWWHN